MDHEYLHVKNHNNTSSQINRIREINRDEKSKNRIIAGNVPFGQTAYFRIVELQQHDKIRRSKNLQNSIRITELL